MNKIMLVVILALASCGSHNTTCKLDYALEQSGGNRIELEKVLNHYSENPVDSLKLKAAKFLIENMPEHYTFGGDYMDKHIRVVDSLNPDMELNHRAYAYSLPLYDAFAGDKLTKEYDIHNITSDFLINNIDFKFKLLELLPWNVYLSFDDFCNYLLPYRIHNEPLIFDDRDTLNKIISDISIAMQSYQDSYIYSSIYVNHIYKYIFKRPNIHSIKSNSNVSHSLYDCNAVTSCLISKNRYTGLATSNDFVPHWGNSDGRHNWCKIYADDLKNNNYNYIERSKMPKVYRRTYSHNPSPKGDLDYIPLLFTPFIKDVTDEYICTTDIEVDFSATTKKEGKNVYLAVFNELKWQPVAWSTINKGGKAIFKSMGRNIVYQPMYYNGEEEVIADYPFILDSRGNVDKLIPNKDRKHNLNLIRKYHIDHFKPFSKSEIIDTYILASNDKSFSMRDTVAFISEFKHTYNFRINDKYRYFKIEFGNYSNIAELHFKSKLKDISYNITSINDRSRGIEEIIINHIKSLIDNNLNTYNIYNELTIDITNSKVSEIKLQLKTDGNYIYPNNAYELLYHNGSGWVSFDAKKAKDYYVEFDNVPQGALYWLRNLTEGKQERIFTYENGKMTFW